MSKKKVIEDVSNFKMFNFTKSPYAFFVPNDTSLNITYCLRRNSLFVFIRELN